MMNTDAVTVEESAALLGVSVATVRRWARLGYIHPIRPHAIPVRYRLAEVLACSVDRKPQTWHRRFDAATHRMLQELAFNRRSSVSS